MQPTDKENSEATRFLAKVAASAAHELNNCLAILGEQGGLVSDLALMMQKGRPLDPARLVAVAEGVKKQVERAGAITANLHTLVHTLDPDAKPATTGAIAELCAALFARTAARARMNLEISVDPETPAFAGNCFSLCRLLFACLEQAAAKLPEGGRATLELGAAEGGFALRLGLAGGVFSADFIQDPCCQALCCELGLCARLAEPGGVLEIVGAK